jgi:hypothetical protein
MGFLSPALVLADLTGALIPVPDPVAKIFSSLLRRDLFLPAKPQVKPA